MARHGLDSSGPPLKPNRMGLGVPKLVRGPVDQPSRPKLADSIALVNTRGGLLGNPASHRLVVGVNRVVVPNVLEVRLRFAILAGLVSPIPLGNRLFR